jgi:membrane-associated phospholipid phosphatase
MTPDPYREADIPLPRLRTISQLWMLAAVLGGAGVAALAIDVPLAKLVRAGHYPDMLAKLCSLSELFSHGLGIVMICVVIAVLDPWHRYAIPRILATALGAGLAANVLKLLVSRARPHHVDLELVDRGLHTFGDWFPLAMNPSWQQGFPSSHTAVAVGLAVVLAAFYPRGRWLFPSLAGLAGLERILHQAHFASDVLWGAAVGCAFAPLCVYGSRLSLALDRLERNLLARRRLTARARTCGRHAAAPTGVRPAA